MLIATSLLIPIVPFVLVGELPGERWLSGWAGAGLILPMLLPVAAWGSWLVYRYRSGVARGAAQ